MGISIQCSKIQHADHTLQIWCQLTLSEVNPNQILLIFVSMQHCHAGKTLLTHFCYCCCCFYASYTGCPKNVLYRVSEKY